MPEQQILGEMLKYLIEDETELTVQLTHGIGGGTANIQPAMEAGKFDLYPEYTGTGWNAVLKENGIYDESRFPEMQQRYHDRFDMQWLGMYGFNNTFGLAVRKDTAEEYNLKTYSDLAPYTSELIFGAEYDFYEREDGYDALCDAYDFHFQSTVDLDIGLKHQAIEQKKIDVMNIFTTDGQLSTSDIVVLEDDQNFYPSYLCGNVVRNAVLERHPELSGVLLLLEGRIHEEDMAALNYLVEIDGQDPQQVAKNFLIEQGLLAES